MQLTNLATLAEVPTKLVVPNSRAIAMRKGTSFTLPVMIEQEREEGLAWSAESPINLAYRWIAEDARVIDRDGRRTAIPGRSLAAGRSVEVRLSGDTPEEAGDYRLLVALVLEGVHWACDVSETGWTQVNVAVTNAPTWPAELRKSPGARALRGALAADQLARDLAGLDLRQDKGRAVLAPEESAIVEAPAAAAPEAGVGRWARWLRRKLGIASLQAQLDGVSKIAAGHERIVRSVDANVRATRRKVSADLDLASERDGQIVEGLSEVRGDIASRLRSIEEGSRTQFEEAARRERRLLDELARLRADVVRSDRPADGTGDREPRR